MNGMSGPKLMTALVLVVMAATFLYVAHMSRQAAEATPALQEGAGTHARRVNMAIRETEQYFGRAGPGRNPSQ